MKNIFENVSNSNLNTLIEHYIKNNKSDSVSSLVEYYQPINGYLYCIVNEMYKHYGENVKKCGNSENPEKRLIQYTTGYIEPSKILSVSDKLINKCFGETLLFYYLRDYRIKNKNIM